MTPPGPDNDPKAINALPAAEEVAGGVDKHLELVGDRGEVGGPFGQEDVQSGVDQVD